MVRHSQLSTLPCEPTSEQSIQFQEEYKKIKGVLSIKSLTKKIQPLFEEHLEQTAKIYSLAAHGTHANFLLNKNKLIYAKQSEGINELSNLSDYLTYKSQEFKQLEKKLMESLENELNSLLQNIQSTIDTIYEEYKNILQDQFQALRQETSEQIKNIKRNIDRLQREFDPQILTKRKLNEQEMIKLTGITREEMYGYSTLFRIVSNETLKELKSKSRVQQPNADRQLAIDTEKIKRINCHQMWELMELIKIKNDNPNKHQHNSSAGLSTDTDLSIFHTQIDWQQVILEFEQKTFKTESAIFEKLSQKVNKKSKKTNDLSMNSSMNEGSSSQAVSLLTDFVKDKPIKKLMKSLEAQIQAQFVKFNQNYNYKQFLLERSIRNKKQKQNQEGLESRGQKQSYLEKERYDKFQPQKSQVNTIIDKLQEINNEFVDSPLMPQQESQYSGQQSQFHYENESIIEQAKKQAEEQYSEYIKRMKMQQGNSQDQNSLIQEQIKNQELQRLQEAENQMKEIYAAYQRKLDEEEEQAKQMKLDEQEDLKRIQQEENFNQLQEQQIQRERQKQFEREIQRQREIQREIETQRIQSLFNPTAKINQMRFKKVQQPVYKPEFIKKDLHNSRVLEQWRQERQKTHQQKLVQEMRERNPMNKMQEEQIDPFADIPEFEKEQQLKRMREYERMNDKKYQQEENTMMRRFKEEVQDSFERKGLNSENEVQQFGFDDYRKEKQAQDSLLNFTISESLEGRQPQKQLQQRLKIATEELKSLQRQFVNPFVSSFVSPFVRPRISAVEPILFKIQQQKNQQEIIDQTMIDIFQLLLGMGQKKTSFSLTDLMYNSEDYDEDQIFFVENAEESGRILLPMKIQNRGMGRGKMTIQQISRQAQLLHTTKEAFSIVVKVIQPVLLTFQNRDQRKNRPMTKLIVGDSTGIGILYMRYYCEVTAGNCLRLDNCRLNQYKQSYEINHHVGITMGNILAGQIIPRVSSEFTLSLIRKIDRTTFQYDLRSSFNSRLSDCISDLKRSKIMSGEMELGRPVIVSVCEIEMGRKCILGDYTGKVAADLSSMKWDVSISKNDTLLLRRAKMQINRGTVVLVAGGATVVIKADIGFKFSHDMTFIPDRILRAQVL